MCLRTGACFFVLSQNLTLWPSILLSDYSEDHVANTRAFYKRTLDWGLAYNFGVEPWQSWEVGGGAGAVS